MAARVRPVYQPVVDLTTREVVGYEALARWPGLALGPVEAFTMADAGGWTSHLDQACQAAALRTALDAGLDVSETLYLNAEPATFAGDLDAELLTMIDRCGGQLRVVVELTERTILEAPRDLLRACSRIRDMGWGIALDDVGAVRDSLSVLPFIEPDVVKLDLALVQQTEASPRADVIAAVLAYVEHSGAVVIAEGIETPAHVEQARSLGATLGQGWYYARAGRLRPKPAPGRAVAPLRPQQRAPDTPYELLDPAEVLVARKPLIVGLANHLEHQAAASEDAPVLLSTFQHACWFGPVTAARYTSLADGCSLVVVFGRDFSDEPSAGVRGESIDPGDPLLGEWSIVVVGAHYAGALIARDCGDHGADEDRRFSYVMTHDRDRVLAAGRSLLRRVTHGRRAEVPGTVAGHLAPFPDP